MGENATKALDSFSSVESDKKNKLISDIGLQLNANRQAILQSNETDMRNAKKKNLAPSNIESLLDLDFESSLHFLSSLYDHYLHLMRPNL